MFFQSKRLRNLLRKWPGERIFGVYRFIPFFFFIGAGLEYSMIKWQVGEVNFYRTYKQKRVQEIVEETLLRESLGLENTGGH